MHLFYKSTFLMIGSKGLYLACPLILGKVVDSLTIASQINFTTAILGIGAYGGARLASSVF